MKDAPLAYLGHLIEGRSSDDRPPAALPDAATLEEWQRDLSEDTKALDYLLTQRGLALETVWRAGLGYDTASDAITLPVHAGGRLVNVRRRYLDPAAKPKIRGLRGRGSHLYPAPPRGNFVLVEGELDCLLARQSGLPAATSTAGTSWSAEWNRFAAGRRIAVLFDSGEAAQAIARKRAAELVAAGALEAWSVDLGLRDGEDVTDWFVTYGRSAPRLKRLINWARRAAA